MKISEFIEIDRDTINAMGMEETVDLLRRFIPQANRRLNKLVEMEITPQALFSRLDEMMN